MEDLVWKLIKKLVENGHFHFLYALPTSLYRLQHFSLALNAINVYEGWENKENYGEEGLYTSRPLPIAIARAWCRKCKAQGDYPLLIWAMGHKFKVNETIVNAMH